MAVSFQTDASAWEKNENGDEDYVEVDINGRPFRAYRLTVAMSAAIPMALTGSSIPDRLGAAYRIIEGLIGPEGLRYVMDLVWSKQMDYRDLIGGSDAHPDGGLIDQILAEFAKVRPSQPSADSSSSRANGGRRSTGRSPGKGSTRSASP